MSTNYQSPGQSAMARLCPPRMWLLSCAGLAALSLVSSATPSPAPGTGPSLGPAAPVQIAQPLAADAPAPPPATTAIVNPMDEPLRLIAEARRAYAQVQDYSCVLVKKEKMGNQPPVENVMNMSIRAQPFSVNLRWMEPKSLRGQEAVYVAGKNNGQMRVKSAGVLGALGFISLAPDDARAQETSKHSITEAGMGNLLERYTSGWENERSWNLSQVTIGEYEFDKRRCVRVETTHPQNPDGRFLFFRNVMYFDKETKLPVRCECYDWPRNEGGQPELQEVYSYIDVKLNVGLSNELFNK